MTSPDLHVAWAVPHPGSGARDRLLSSEERRRARRIHSSAARGRFVTGRLLLRRLVAEVLDLRPDEVELVTEEGRVRLPAPTPLSVSVSHTPDLVVAVVSTAPAVGIDVERADRAPLPPWRLWLDDEEQARFALGSDLGGASQRELVRTWTAKEAVAKALGAGPWLPLRSVAVHGLRVHVPSAPRTAWHVRHWATEEPYITTIALPDLGPSPEQGSTP